MGCGASTSEYTQAPGRRQHVDDDDSSDSEKSNRSARSSSRGATYVTSTRNRVASSSTTTPRLAEAPAYEPENPTDMPTMGGQTQTQPEPAKTATDDFIFGDFKVDPQDAVEVKRERFRRGRRTSYEDAVQKPRRTSGEIFMLNDFVVDTVVDREAEAPRPHEIPVPRGFHQLMGVETTCLIGLPDRIKALACARDEKSYLSVAVQDFVVAMSQMGTGEELNCFPGHSTPVVALTCSRDGKYFASSARDGSLVIWEYTFNREHSMKKKVREFDPESTGGAVAISLTFSFDGKQLVAGCQDRMCRVWNVDRHTVARTYEEHDGICVGLAAHPSEPLVASGCSDRTIHIWRLTDGERVLVLRGHEGPVIGVSFTPDGLRILANDDKQCKVWSAKEDRCLLTVTLETLTRSSMAQRQPPPAPTTNNGDLLADWQRRYPSSNERILSALDGPHSVVRRVKQSKPMMRTLLTVSSLLPGALSGSYFAVACTNKLVYIVSMANGTEAGVIETKAPVFAMSCGTQRAMLCGDIFGNIYRTYFRGPSVPRNT